jgi:hypothetical protein
LPNAVQIITQDHKFSFANETLIKVKVVDESKVEANGVSGTWDILFDQSLVVSLDNGYRYTADLRYNLKPDVSAQH